MTEREAEAFAKRLTRIWEPTSPFTFEHMMVNGVNFGFIWQAYAPFSLRVALQLSIVRLTNVFDVRLIDPNVDRSSTDSVIWADADGIRLSRDNRSLAIECLPHFRCGCWLSGCLIEASAHEKTEWMQGFSREELNAWKLTF